jgi:hypothetical protein
MRASTRIVVLVVAAMVTAGAALAGFPGTDVFLPMAGRQAGVHPSNWYTKVWIHNPGADAVTARLYLLPRGSANPAPAWVDVVVAGGATEAIDNVVEALFHVQVMGAMRVTAPSRLLVTSRVYSMAAGQGEKDTVGQDFAAVPAAFAIGLNERTTVLGVNQTAPSEGSPLRFNYGLVETTGHATTVHIRVIDTVGTELGSEDLQVLAWSQRQVAFKDHFQAISAEDCRLDIEVTAGSGRVIAYGSAIANESQDPTTFEMAYPEAALAGVGLEGVAAGLGLVGGGSTGTVTLDVGAGDGLAVEEDTVSIADRGVTPAKIAPSSEAGQVLATVSLVPRGPAALAAASNAVAWRDDGLSLPWSGAASSGTGTDAFVVTNLGSGRAIHAVSGTDTAIWAESAGGIAGLDARNTTGHGVSATSTSGTGARGTSSSGRGVWGTSATGPVGVLGEHTGQGDGVLGTAAGTGAGVHGASVGGEGVLGEGATYGVHGRGTGATDKSGVFGEHTTGGYGVRGTTTSATTAGVFGVNGGTGAGVKGQSLEGTGVFGTSGFKDMAGLKAGVIGENTGGGNGVVGRAGTGMGVWAISGTTTLAALSATNYSSGDVIDGWHGSGDRVFRVTNNGEVYADGTFHSSGADFAEMLPGSGELEPGDVLAIAPDGTLTRTSEAFQASVAGVYSTRPGYLGGSTDDLACDRVPLAVVGIVPVKVSVENGAILPGDLLVASSTPGRAMRAGVQPPVGTVIGKALDSVASGTAVISALVFLH